MTAGRVKVNDSTALHCIVDDYIDLMPTVNLFQEHI